MHAPCPSARRPGGGCFFGPHPEENEIAAPGSRPGQVSSRTQFRNELRDLRGCCESEFAKRRRPMRLDRSNRNVVLAGDGLVHPTAPDAEHDFLFPRRKLSPAVEHGREIGESHLFSGVIRKADTLDEVADVIGCKTRVLKETVDRYNGFVRTGKDEDFGKQTLLQTIEKPPFYFGEERLNVHSTEGGLRIDAEARVLDRNHRPIPGLYAAGETVGGIHGRSRPGGNGTLACVVFGRIAGKSAAIEK